MELIIDLISVFMKQGKDRIHLMIECRVFFVCRRINTGIRDRQLICEFIVR